MGWPTASMHTSTPRPFGRRARGGARVALLQVHGLRAEGLRHRQALGHRVDRDHVRRAGRPRGLHRAQPHRPEAEHRRDVPGAQAAVDAPRDSRCPSRRRRTAPRRRSSPPAPAQHEIGARHERPLGLRALQRAERRAVAEGARGLALVKGARAAEEAAPAGRLKAAEHAVADARPRAPSSPTASTVPTYSWPIVKPGSICTRPW